MQKLMTYKLASIFMTDTFEQLSYITVTAAARFHTFISISLFHYFDFNLFFLVFITNFVVSLFFSHVLLGYSNAVTQMISSHGHDDFWNVIALSNFNFVP